MVKETVTSSRDTIKKPRKKSNSTAESTKPEEDTYKVRFEIHRRQASS